MATIISKAKHIGYWTRCKTCKTVFSFSHQETVHGQGSGRLLTFCPYCEKVVYYNPFTWKKVKING